MMRHSVLPIVVVLLTVVSACKTDEPIAAGCITSLECDQGYECVAGECVPQSGGGDTEVVDDAPVMPDDQVLDDQGLDESSDMLLPDETTDELADALLPDEPMDGAIDEDVVTESDLPPTDEDAVVPDIDYEAPPICEGYSCNGHGLCKDVGGTPVCECDAAYKGDHCESCNTGYQDKDSNGVCEPNCVTAQLQCPGGYCTDVSGTPVCACNVGFQDNDDDGVCLPNCANAALDCGSNGQCDDSSGTPECACKTGYQDNDNNDTCLPNCTTAGLTCTGGACDDSSGVAKCTCTDANYQDNDSNGTCLPTCAKAIVDGLVCPAHSSCDDASGTATCVCADGYTGANCDQCASGFHLSGSDCVPNESCPANYCNGHGTCSDATGTPVCSCSTGYTGTTCLDCASGYQDSDSNGTCLADCDDSCGQSGGFFPESHGTCTYPGGVAECTCDAGWKDPLLIWPPMSPECSECKKNDPPPEYQTYGCPADCDSDPVVSCTGDCYYDKTSGDKYCVP